MNVQRRTSNVKSAKALPAKRLWIAIGLLSLLTVGLLYILYTYEVPLGETGKFLYRYSKMLPQRLGRAFALLPALALFALAARFLARPGNKNELAGLSIGAIGILALTAWTWWLPPHFLQQHAMNLLSPSHEGAFLIEAATEVKSTGSYLRRFDHQRLPRSVEQMRGTRILSNTPATTLLAWWTICSWPVNLNHPGLFEQYLLNADTRPVDIPAVSYAMKFSVVLAGLWGFSSLFAYLLGRQFLSPLGAGLFAVLVTFNPATANFVPGKDPAQLLTINAMLWAWFSGVRKQSFGRTSLAGAILVVGMAWGLIHAWIALTAFVGTIAIHKDKHTPLFKPGVFLRYFVGPMIGAAAVTVAVYYLSGWNMPATFFAVSRRYEEVQHWISYDRTLWFWIGLPLFLLFVSPALYVLIVIPRSRWRIRRGIHLLGSTVLVMALVYCVGVTYELPRLWVAFVPLLTLGAMIGWPALRARDGRRALRLALLLMLVNCIATAMHAAALDARESEYRLTKPDFFN